MSFHIFWHDLTVLSNRNLKTFLKTNLILEYIYCYLYQKHCIFAEAVFIMFMFYILVFLFYLHQLNILHQLNLQFHPCENFYDVVSNLTDKFDIKFQCRMSLLQMLLKGMQKIWKRKHQELREKKYTKVLKLQHGRKALLSSTNKLLVFVFLSKGFFYFTSNKTIVKSPKLELFFF